MLLEKSLHDEIWRLCTIDQIAKAIACFAEQLRWQPVNSCLCLEFEACAGLLSRLSFIHLYNTNPKLKL